MQRGSFANHNKSNMIANNDYSLNLDENKTNNRSLSNMKMNSRPQRIIGAQIIDARRGLTTNTGTRRALPIEPKKGVFNEWAAILKYNDEKDQKKDYDELANRKSKIDEYKKLLVNQIKNQHMKTNSLADQKLIELQVK
jgi:hypothetical protein